jgi:hypothetical protein
MKTTIQLTLKIGFISFAAAILLSTSLLAWDLRREVTLKGNWKFEVGDDMKFAEPNYDDSDWDEIYVPGNWEDQGFPGYDGYAWYRTTFRLTDDLKDKRLYLDLGCIDDVDVVYINGIFVDGRGGFPPDYETAYNTWRLYPIPSQNLRFNSENVIAIRVYDEELVGGIVSGGIGIYSDRQAKLNIDLAGRWKFHTGDEDEWCDRDYDDSKWGTLSVPANWDSQGHRNYDGYAWYRTEVIIPKQLKDSQLVLLLGKIDDFDEVYLNGQKIGHTGIFPGEHFRGNNNPYWNRDRHYYIPENLIEWGGKNTIAVRVYDVWNLGGIYDGPVGIATKENYLKFRKNRDYNITINNNGQDFFDVIDEVVKAFEQIF